MKATSRIFTGFVTMLCLFPAMIGCGRSPAVSAATPAVLTCTSPAVFRGTDDGVQSFAVFTLCGVGQADGNPMMDVVYTIGHDFIVDSITTWLGTTQGSIEETAGEVTIETPTATAGQFRTKWIITNQKDKHTDVEGDRIEHFSPRQPTLLPSGTRIVFHMNIGVVNSAQNCPQGCGMQLNVYMNGQ